MTSALESEQRRRWDDYGSSPDCLKDYEAWLASFGKSQLHLMYRQWVRGGKILEIGCGAGHLITALREDCSARDITGLDISAGMLKLAASRGCSSLVEGSASDLPFAEGSFDTVIAAVWVFRYLPDRERALREVRRVLRAGGELLFDVPLFTGAALEAVSEVVRCPLRWRHILRNARLRLNPISSRAWTKRLAASKFSVLRVAGVLELPWLTHRLRWAPVIENPLLQNLCLSVLYHAKRC